MNPQGNGGFIEVQMHIIVLKLRPSSAFRRGHGEKTAIGGYRNVIVAKRTADDLTPCGLDGDGDVEMIEDALPQTQWRIRIGDHSNGSIFKSTLPDEVGRSG